MNGKYKVNLFKASMPPYEDYCDVIKVIWENKRMSNSGVLNNELEEKLKSYLGVDNCLLCTNGHMALEIALQGLQLKGEVITTPFTFISTTQSIVRSGLIPKFCDIDPDRLTIDPNLIEKQITDKTSAILGVHVYGIPCDVHAIQEIAERHNLKVIYDAAHAFGCTYHGRGIGSFGDVSTFSLHATKVFNTAEGGAVTFSNDKYAENFKNISNFGFCSQTDANLVGFNARMSEFHAALGLCNLKTLDSIIKKRERLYNQYVEQLSESDVIIIPSIPEGSIQTYSYFPIILDTENNSARDMLFKYLDECGIESRRYFYPLTTQFSCFNGQFSEKTPVASRIQERVLCLPLFPDMTEEQVCYVTQTVLDFIIKNRKIL